MKIREIKKGEVAEIVEIWYKSSILAHYFIPVEYWRSNKKVMEEKYIPMSETYIATDGEKILGFVSLLGDNLAAIFVRPEIQGGGIGSSLLNHAKGLRKKLELKVYQKNRKSTEFYKAKGFSVIAESKDKDTGEEEFVMKWNFE